MKLNFEQEKAANILEGNLVIIASAGTGKTTTIVERYVNLIEKRNLLPEEIMMTTFTNKAAKDMIKKIENRTKKISPYIGTMHSLFLRILRNHPKESFNDKIYTLITETSEQKKIIKELLEKENINSKADSVNYFYGWISKFKNRGILSESLSWEGGIDEAKENGIITEILDDEIIQIDLSWRKEVNKIYKKYQEYLRKENLLDFDEILLLTYKLFETNPKILNYYKNNFKSIMVDEAQDLNVIQIKILDQLRDNNLCLIGDDCQNIYEWRGSSNDLIFNFEKNEEKIYLNKNYRSTENIILAVNEVIASMNKKIDKKLISTRKPKENFSIKGFRNFNEELTEIAENISKLISSGEKIEEIAVLFRTNLIGKSVEREFRRRKIPCHLSKSIDFFSREEVRDITSFLKLIINPESTHNFERIISLINGFGKAKISRIKEEVQFSKLNYLEILKESEKFNFGVEIDQKINLLLESINSDNPLEKFLERFDYYSYLEKKYFKEKEKLEDKFENISVLMDLYNSSKNEGKNLVEFLDSLIEIEKKEKNEEKIILTTIHGAKGLEWKHVFLISCNECILPFYKGELSNSKKDAELRLFYVAISRAKDNLNLSYSYFQGAKYYSPSQFLDILYQKDFICASEI